MRLFRRHQLNESMTERVFAQVIRQVDANLDKILENDDPAVIAYLVMSAKSSLVFGASYLGLDSPSVPKQEDAA